MRGNAEVPVSGKSLHTTRYDCDRRRHLEVAFQLGLMASELLRPTQNLPVSSASMTI